MHNFVNTHCLVKLNQGQISNINRPLTPREIETVIISLQVNNSLGTGSFDAKLYQTFKEELMPILLKSFHKIEQIGTSTNSFDEATVILTPKPYREPTKKKN